MNYIQSDVKAGVEFQTTLNLVFNSLTLEEEPFLVCAKFILPLLLIFLNVSFIYPIANV